MKGGGWWWVVGWWGVGVLVVAVVVVCVWMGRGEVGRRGEKGEGGVWSGLVLFGWCVCV